MNNEVGHAISEEFSYQYFLGLCVRSDRICIIPRYYRISIQNAGQSIWSVGDPNDYCCISSR